MKWKNLSHCAALSSSQAKTQKTKQRHYSLRRTKKVLFKRLMRINIKDSSGNQFKMKKMNNQICKQLLKEFKRS
jgi:hypothetical protein